MLGTRLINRPACNQPDASKDASGASSHTGLGGRGLHGSHAHSRGDHHAADGPSGESATPSGSKRGRVLLWTLLLCVSAQLAWQFTTLTIKRYSLHPSYPQRGDDVLRAAGEREHAHALSDAAPSDGPGWQAALQLLRGSRQKYVIVDAKNGLGNRLRALASAMSVAASLNRPVLLIWVPDLHCNCSFRNLFASPLHFALLEEDMPKEHLVASQFQVYNYMRPEPGAVKDAPVFPDPRRHLYFKSGFLMKHRLGGWKHAQRHLQMLEPVDEVKRHLVATKSMVGLHIRNVFDAPRDAATNKSVVGRAAVVSAEKEYGAEGTKALLQWRRASHWTNFVQRITSLLREDSFRHPNGNAQETLSFYLAADSEEAYTGLIKRFPNRLKFTRRQCATERCDFRDCSGMIFSLVDMINLARTRLILGSGWSSYSEVAAYWGGKSGQPVPILMAGRDFGVLVDSSRNPRSTPKPACCLPLDAVATTDREMASNIGLQVDDQDEQFPAVQQHWPQPF